MKLTMVLLWGLSGLLGADGAVVPVRQAVAPPASPATAVPGPGPRIRFAETVHDFGKIEVGTVVKHDFVFTNIGTAVLEITEVRPGCGCTTTGTWDRRVEPGQTGKIPLQFNSSGFSGTIGKNMTVFCNDPERATLFLQVRGTVWRPIEITPPSLYFSVAGETATNETRVVRIINNLDEPLTLSDPACTNQSLGLELRTVTEGKEYELRVTTRPPFSTGHVQAPVTLSTSVTNPAVITIPTYVYVQPAVQVVPSHITIPSGQLAASFKPAITIRGTGTNTLSLSDPAIDLEGATVTVREIQPGKVFTVQLSLPAGFQLQPTQKAVLSVKTSHPRFPVITVPLIQSQRPLVLPSQRTPAAVAPRSQPPPPPPPLLARPLEFQTPPPMPTE
ncbi:MAG TPA: DUF1573 domain-containing protein [Verrucomicrobiota bacterium]|nr:DUF1573 domain-containing protein [Verrucomicrobiota bacterium]HNU52413.1 DUF1573 domain-containing protein [Verrucomicrobiota bacterium]